MIALSLVSSLRRINRLIDNHAPMISIVQQLSAIHAYIEDWFSLNGLDIKGDYNKIPLPRELRSTVFFRTGSDRMRVEVKQSEGYESEGNLPAVQSPLSKVHRLYTDEQLKILITKANERFNALTPLQQEEHRAAQAESFARGMTARCEHGELDFEQCPKCRTRTNLRLMLVEDDPTITDEEIESLFKEAGVE